MGAAEEDDERRLERPMHLGCMAGFFHLFDRPQILSGKRLYHPPRRLLSPNSAAGSATPSEKSMQLERTPELTPVLSPDMTPPAAPRPSLQLPPLDLKEGPTAAWRMREVPRLSLDSRAVVDARGKLRPREIRTTAAAPPSPAGEERRSPSVIARLMGLDALPDGAAADGHVVAGGGKLRRSASERVPRDPSYYRFVDPTFFEKPAPPPLTKPPSAGADAVLRRSPDPAGPRALHRRSRFDARDVFPEPAKRASPDAGAGQGEIALYGEIERRLRKRGIAEPAKDIETLKQILEALQLKGLLHHTAPHPVSARHPPPPIVVMRPSPRPPQPPPARTTPARRVRVDVDRARRPRSPDPAASPARSPASPARRGPQSPQRRVSPAHSPRQQCLKKQNTADATGVRSRIARRAAQNTAAPPSEDDASTTFSDGGSSGSFSSSSRWDFEQRVRSDDLRTDRGLLERCGKLLNSIEAFTACDAVLSAIDQQPSPVSVLDAASFLADEDSPSSSASKRAIDFGAPSPKPVTIFDPEDDEWAPENWLMGPETNDPDYAYVAKVVWLFDRMRNPADVYKVAEGRREMGCDTWQHRRLLCGAVAEVLDRRRAACPWDPAAQLQGNELIEYVWVEVRRAQEPVAPVDDLNDLTCGAIRRDLAVDRRWSHPSADVVEAVVQIERLVFKDLVADTIRELADVALGCRVLRRKLVF